MRSCAGGGADVRAGALAAAPQRVLRGAKMLTGISHKRTFGALSPISGDCCMSTFQSLTPAARRGSLASAALLAFAALVPFAASVSVAADAPPIVNEKFTDLEPGIKMLRAEVGQDRRDIVAASMLLTKSEGEIFWPMYDQYRAAQHAVGDQKVLLISNFIAYRDMMSEDQAAKITKDALALEKKRTANKEEYVGKMSKVLSARTVARFFQIDTKLDAVVDAALAARIPLMH
jgi:hypothetical protein